MLLSSLRLGLGHYSFVRNALYEVCSETKHRESSRGSISHENRARNRIGLRHYIRSLHSSLDG